MGWQITKLKETKSTPKFYGPKETGHNEQRSAAARFTEGPTAPSEYINGLNDLCNENGSY